MEWAKDQDPGFVSPDALHIIRLPWKLRCTRKHQDLINNKFSHLRDSELPGEINFSCMAIRDNALLHI